MHDSLDNHPKAKADLEYYRTRQQRTRITRDLLGAYSGLDHYQVIEYRLADTRRILANAVHAAAIAMALSPYEEVES